MLPSFQPFVHDLVTTVAAPSVTLSGPDGQLRGVGAHGFFLGERRMLSVLRLQGFGREPEVIRTQHDADGLFEVIAVMRDGTEPTPDPTLLLSRRRRQTRTGFVETWSMSNRGFARRAVDLALVSATDFADMTAVKGGFPPATSHDAAIEDGVLTYRCDAANVAIIASGDPTVDAATGTLRWVVAVEPKGQAVITVEVRGSTTDAAFRGSDAVPWQRPVVTCADERFVQLVEWGFCDLAGMLLADNDVSADVFVGAGSPWFLTLFGRDSLWTARMLMPFGVDLAASTLRVLARKQGTRVDPASAEQPGRILHEARPDTFDMGHTVLPAVYYGSIDATPLWIITLAEAWRWGLADESVTALLPALCAAARWLVDDSDADGDGLIEYIDETGRALSNQGWKDSGDSVNWIDGRLAEPPIALAEVQGYAYQAALDAAELFDAFGVDGAAPLRAFAGRLRAAFHQHYWLTDGSGRYIAVALDRHKKPVDTVTTNPGHLLATGLLDADQEVLVVARLMSDLACPAGLRTLAPGSGRFSPIGYHNGSVWPHDVAICARGMMLSGFADEAGEVLRGLFVAVETFGGRLPELFGYDAELGGVVPYPASCLPQAWSAATAAVALWAAAPVVPGADGARVLKAARLVDDVEFDGLACAGQRFRAVCRDGTVELLALTPSH
jgi:glycogen debranching enzyme